MKVLLNAAAWTVAMLSATVSAASKDNQPIKPKELNTIPFTVKSSPKVIPNYFLLAQNSEPAKQKVQEVKEEKYRFIKNRHLELALQDTDSILFSVIINHPEFKITRDLEKYARNNKSKSISEYIAMNLPKEWIIPEDLEEVKNNSSLPFYKGVKNNPSNSDNKDLISKVRGEQLKSLTDLLKRRPTDTDLYFAEEFPDSLLAGLIAASENNHVVNVSYTRSHSNTLYGRNTLMHKNAGKEVFEKTIKHHSKKENANSQEAEILGSILTKEQLTPEIKTAVRGELRKTAFAKGVASNKNFWDEIPSLDNPKTRDDVLYMMNNPNDPFSEGVASIVEVTDGLKSYSLENKTFQNSNSARALTKNPDYWKNGSSIGATGDFIFSENNHGLALSLGSVENCHYFADSGTRKLLKELAKKQPEAEILYLASRNPNYLKSLTEKELEDEFKFILDSHSRYSEGIAEALPVMPGNFVERLTEKVIENPRNRYLAKGLMARSDFQPSKIFTDFVTDEKNLKLPASLEYIKSKHCMPSRNLFLLGKQDGYEGLRNALESNPYVTLLADTSKK